MRRIYLDSIILIAYFAIDKAEEPKQKLVDNALAVFELAKDVQLCTPMRAVTEMVNILVSWKKMDRADVAEIESRLDNERLKEHVRYRTKFLVRFSLPQIFKIRPKLIDH